MGQKCRGSCEGELASTQMFVCMRRSFERNCFFQNQISMFVDGRREMVPRKQLRLMPDCLPTIFPISENAPTLLQNVVPPNIFLESTSTDPSDFANSSANGQNTDKRHEKTNLSQSFVPPDVLFEKLSKDTIDHASISVNGRNAEDNVDYNIDKVIAEWREGETTFSDSWGFVRVPSNGVLFLIYTHWESTQWRGILVHADMTIKAMAKGKLVNFPTTLSRITCLEDLLSTMRKMSLLQVCEGTSTEFCPMGLYKRKMSSKCNRCSDCRKKYRLTYEKLRKQEARNKKKKQMQKELNKSLQQEVRKSHGKVAKLEQVIDKLQTDLEDMQDKFASMNENFMNHPFIQKLPHEMQETIRACWNLSKCSNKKVYDTLRPGYWNVFS